MAGPLVVTQRGRAMAVLRRIDAYEKSEHERNLLHLLATGEKEIAVGEGHTPASVFKDADSFSQRCQEQVQWLLEGIAAMLLSKEEELLHPPY